jgi:hypothetical protein
MSPFAVGTIIFLLCLNTILLALLAYALLQVAIQVQKTARSLEARLDRLERATLPALESLGRILETLEHGIKGFGAFQQASSGARSFAAALEWAKALGLVDLASALFARFFGRRKSGRSSSEKSASARPFRDS